MVGSLSSSQLCSLEKEKNASIVNYPSSGTAKAPNKGNHRLNSIKYTIMASTYDNSQRLITPGSVAIKWIVKNIIGLKGLNATSVKTMMKQTATNIRDAIEDATKDENLMLNN